MSNLLDTIDTQTKALRTVMAELEYYSTAFLTTGNNIMASKLEDLRYDVETAQYKIYQALKKDIQCQNK